MWSVIWRFRVSLIGLVILGVAALILWLLDLKWWITVAMILSIFMPPALEAILRPKQR